MAVIAACLAAGAAPAAQAQLFDEAEPLAITLAFDPDTLCRAGAEVGCPDSSGTLTYIDGAGAARALPVWIRARGRWRNVRANCSMPPLSVIFDDATTAGTLFAGETRPWLQGARLTVWELQQDGIDATLIADSAAAHLMKTGAVQWIVVGADRICANGDTANKIGTYALAIAARHHGVKFMVVAPSSTVDLDTPDGAAIEIEQRDPGELHGVGGVRTVAEGIAAWNPVFDVTPAALIDAIVTEKGVVEQPDTAKMRALFGA